MEVTIHSEQCYVTNCLGQMQVNPSSTIKTNSPSLSICTQHIRVSLAQIFVIMFTMVTVPPFLTYCPDVL